MVIVERWRKAAEIVRGPLLRPVYCGHPIPRYMEPYSVGHVLKKLAVAAGLDDVKVRQI